MSSLHVLRVAARALGNFLADPNNNLACTPLRLLDDSDSEAYHGILYAMLTVLCREIDKLGGNSAEIIANWKRAQDTPDDDDDDDDEEVTVDV